MKFNLLGPFEITTDEGDPAVRPTPKVCHVLALLLTQVNHIVPASSLIQEVWGDDPPRSALTTLQTYVYHARRFFLCEGLADPAESVLLTRAPGYLIQLDNDNLDSKRFEKLVRLGQRELDQGFTESAARTLRNATDLWCGPALGNIAVGNMLSEYVAYMEALRIRAVELRIEAVQRLGQHREIIPELLGLTQAHPLNEWFHAQLIECLSLSGRRAEALQAYHRLRRSLADELGLEPSPELQRLHHRVLEPSPRKPVRAA
ncbi:AfsR/SARP family transcriptional regulator [Streptomyces chrestomyceticus]|uniref:AfsR/SARP family transcriptional regulator n=1 Tax=Streptomyces chrestomyceticus TaxID=68185 RepID=UPI0037A8C1D0